MKETESRKVCHKTDEWIWNGLLEVLETRPLDSVHVTDICRKCEVARKTFYRHFRDIESVFDWRFQQLCQEYMKAHPPLDAYEFSIACADFFRFWQNHLEELSILQKSCGTGFVSHQILKHAGTVISSRMEEKKNLALWPLYTTGGLCQILEWWIQNGGKPDADRLISSLVSEQALLNGRASTPL